jgi:hypothetical protein
MTSYLTIPSTDGVQARRVDFGAIAELFSEVDAIVEAPAPRRRVATAFRAFVAPFQETLALLRDEADQRDREQQARRAGPAISAWGIQ